MSDVQPYIGRIAVVDPPAIEQKRASGLLLAADLDFLNKGIVIGVGEEVPLLVQGAVVYYLSENGSLEIDGIKFLTWKAVVAWEAPE